MVINARGIIYFCDKEKNRIVRLKPGAKDDPCRFKKLGKSGQFKSPMGLTLNENGDLVVCDTDHDRIQVIEPKKGNVRLMFGSKGTNNGQFNSPEAVAVDASGNMWISDYENNRIQVHDSMGNYLKTIPCAHPRGIGFDKNSGNIVVAELDTNMMHIISPEGRTSVSNHKIQGPCGLAIDSQGKILVASQGTNSIVILSSSGQVERVLTKDLLPVPIDDWCPGGVSIDHLGNLIITHCNEPTEMNIFG